MPQNTNCVISKEKQNKKTKNQTKQWPAIEPAKLYKTVVSEFDYLAS